MARISFEGGRPRVHVNMGTGRFSKYAILGIVGVMATMFVYMSFTVYVHPNELAVKQIYIGLPFGPEKGMQPEIYGPGIYFVLRGMETLHTFPRDLQILELNDNTVESSAVANHAPSIRIQTSEGYQVTVDVTVTYRVVNPVQVINSVGPGRLYESQLVLPRADRYLRQTLGELNAEDFYEGSLRMAMAARARNMLAADLEKDGIQIWSVMVRHYQYDARYQEAIEQRKIQDQTVFKNRAEAHAASQEAEKNRVLAEGAATVAVEKERGDAQVRMIKSDGDLYFRSKVAEGDKLVALAEAEAIRLKNDALQAAGASNVVGLEMAEVLRGTRVIMVPTDGATGTNPLNLTSLMKGW